jgi:hypothetical protein
MERGLPPEAGKGVAEWGVTGRVPAPLVIVSARTVERGSLTREVHPVLN